jgi:hypothetical protein
VEHPKFDRRTMLEERGPKKDSPKWTVGTKAPNVIPKNPSVPGIQTPNKPDGRDAQQDGQEKRG